MYRVGYVTVRKSRPSCMCLQVHCLLVVLAAYFQGLGVAGWAGIVSHCRLV